MRKARKEHVAAQPDTIKALLFHRPPRPVLEKISAEAVIGLYHATPDEAPAAGYARFFQEQGHIVALPQFEAPDAPMGFAEHIDPFDQSDLVEGPFGMRQPDKQAPTLVPDVIFAPLVGFTAAGERLGQGGGHYDRWLSEHPGRIAIGLAWDVQFIEDDSVLPTEPHDVALDLIVTPTRIYGNL